MRFRLPDPVIATIDQEHAPGVWMSASDPGSSVMMQVPDLGPFVRALLPVRLTAGHTVTFGVWVSVHPDVLQQAFASWWTPQYQHLEMDGYLANRVGSWDVFPAPVHLAVPNPNHTPYCTSSDHPMLSTLLSKEWDHEIALSTLPKG